jgi:hypothetical protein
MSEIKPSRFSYNFLIEFFYNFELCDHTSYYPLLFRLIETDAANIEKFSGISKSFLKNISNEGIIWSFFPPNHSNSWRRC